MTSIDPSPGSYSWQSPLRWLAAAIFVAAGINHFVKPDFYRRIVPPLFPAPGLLVAVSGVFEIVGGAGLLVRPLRRTAGWGLIALLIAVFPANIYMAVCREQIPGNTFPAWLLWLRLPMQIPLIAWVWAIALRKERQVVPPPCQGVAQVALRSKHPPNTRRHAAPKRRGPHPGQP